MLVLVVVDCFPCRQSEEDDDHEDDQETPAPSRIVLDFDLGRCQSKEVEHEHD
jgi:hypothetical protein